jgi:hypothetical protein
VFYLIFREPFTSRKATVALGDYANYYLFGRLLWLVPP